MLDLLVKYAHDHKLVAEPGFAPKTVRWCLSFDSNANFLGVIELGDISSKRNPGQTFPACPDLQQPELVGGSEVRCHFLIETAQVIGLLFKDEADEKMNGGRTREKRAFFTRMLHDAGSDVPQLSIAAKALDNETLAASIRDELQGKKAKPTDKVTIAVDNAFPVELDTWHPWWRKFRAGLKGKKPGDNVMRCFVTGDLQEPVSSHLTVSGLS
ncbi:MAG TPA: hypothetical protein DCL60_00900, partial [Armatimonadetes bacterium]|nr:hypothetical protein [Armatimonadota bacterium]